MYFVKRGSDIYHIIEDASAGRSPCGQEADKLDLWRYQQGEPTENITEEKPGDKHPCKHCFRIP